MVISNSGYNLLAFIKTDTFAFSDLFNYIWHITQDEIENDVKDQKLLGLYIAYII